MKMILLQAVAICSGAYLNSHTDDAAFLTIYVCHFQEEWKENMVLYSNIIE
mgnify:CR=1 FL=1|jgi:H+/gluconate symporter-like permease